MKRPLEADYASHVAYTRGLEEYCDWLVKSEQEPTVLIQSHRENFWCEDLTCKKCYGADFRFKHAPPKQEARNFCPRCGKRTPDLAAVHTCTPPRGLENT